MQSKSLLKIFKVIPLILLLIRELVVFKPDVVYFSISPLGVAFLRDVLFVSILKLFRCRVIYHLHGKGIGCVESRVLKFFYRYVFNNSSVICLSSLLANDIAGVKGNAKVYICENGVIAEAVKGGRSVAENTVRLLFLSNLLPSKGIDIYLKATSRLAAEGADIEINIAGACNSKFKQEDLNRFLDCNQGLMVETHYHGSVSGMAKWELLRDMDVLVHPTLNDAFPLVILEAMAAGCIVVSTRQGGIPDILKGKSFGFLLDEITEDCLYEQLKSLLVSQNDFHQWSRDSKSEFNEKYTFDKFERRVCDIIGEV